MKSVKGFTLIEILIVIAIISVLLGLSVSGANSLRENQYITAEAQNVLSSVQNARSYSINAQVLNASDPWIYGYVYVFYTQGNDHGYCIDKWYDTSSGDPTSTSFVFPGTLSQRVAATPSITFNSANIQCIGFTGDGKEGFLTVETKVYDNRADFSFVFSPVNVKYVAFENITGNAYFFDSNGAYISSLTYPISITLKDNNGNKKVIEITTQYGRPAYIL